jgi:rhodanese-related sulfurtransferase/rubrerythrin
MPGPIRPEDLRQMIEKGDDTSFCIIDVRPSSEYRLDHIPGAVNIPLKEIESRDSLAREGADVVFYCRNGMRSKVAAILAIDAGLNSDAVYSLDGGMAAYTGEILLELPKLALFEETDPPSAVATALNLEKGAWQFYKKAAGMKFGKETIRFLEKMAAFETDHARSLFRRLDISSHSFEAYFDQCPGDILEGGKSFEEAAVLFSPGTRESDILDMALEIEVGAYDLYKRTAVQSGSEEAESFFMGLAAAEKKHMTLIVDFLSKGNS